MRRFLLPCVAVLFSAVAAEARVFNINKETFAAYFDIGAGGSQLNTSALDGEAGAGITYSGKVSYNYSGEFGFIYSHPYVSLRFGLEILKPLALEGATASNGSDDLYTANSEVFGYAPKIGIEFNLHGNNTSRSFVAVGVGSASVTMKNSYTLTAAGQTAFPGVANHDIETKGSGTLLNASLGYEGLLTDTTTIVVEFGYRQMKVDNLEYTGSATTFQGAVSSGDKVTTSSGAARELDFSGAFIVLGFRFYL